MGGFGSGRTDGDGRRKVEACRSIDVNGFRRANFLSNGWSGGWSWWRDGEKISSIGIKGGVDHIELIYRHKGWDEEWQDIVERIPIRWRRCRFGGQRPFFECPGVVRGVACERLVTKLYGGSRYYLCRQCHRLAYSSQSEDVYDRAQRRANKIRTRLGGEPTPTAELPDRPKGMWDRTYSALIDACCEAEDIANLRLGVLAQQLLGLNATLTARAKKKDFWQ